MTLVLPGMDLLRSVRTGHPRLLILPADLARCRHYLAEHAPAQDLAARLLQRGEQYLLEPSPERLLERGTQTARSMLELSRLVLDRVYTLGIVLRCAFSPPESRWARLSCCRLKTGVANSTKELIVDQSQDQSSLQPLRVGVVGLGWAGRTHAEAYQEQPNVSVVALAAHEEDRLAGVGEALGVPYRYQHWEDLVARDDIDAISVATPNFLHAPITIAALQSGKHVLCEKPLARSAGEAMAMVQAAAEAGRVLKVAFNHRQRGDVQLLKRYLTSGGLGEIYYAKARWLRRSGIPGLGSWFTSKELAGGGPLIDLGVHVLDMALYLLDEPRAVSVSATTYAKLGPRSRGGRGDLRPQVSDKFEVEDLATAFVRLADGGTLFLEASWATYREAGDDFGVQLFGTDGGAEINVKNYGWENTLRIYTDVSGVPADIHPHVGRGDGHLGVVREFVEIIRGGNWSAHTGLEGLYRVQLIDACYASALAGREVVLSESAPEPLSS